MSRSFRLGGVIASIILIAFGIGAIVIGATGRADVQDKQRGRRSGAAADASAGRTARP